MSTNVLLTKKPDTEATLVMSLGDTLVIAAPLSEMTSWAFHAEVQPQLTSVGYLLAWQLGTTGKLVLDTIMCSSNAFEFELKPETDPVNVIADILARVSETVGEISASYRFVQGVNPKPLLLDNADVQADLRAFAR